MKEHLNEGEKIIKEFGVSLNYIKAMIIVGALTIWIFGFGLLFILPALYQKYAIKYALTNKRVFVEKGLLNKAMTSVNYSKITDVSLVQNWFYKKAFDMGSVLVNTAGTTFHEIVLKDVEDPINIKKEIEKRIK